MKKSLLIKTPLANIFYLLTLFLLALLALVKLSGHTAHAATIVVNTTADELNGSTGNGTCSLREAIRNANGNNSNQVDCLAGSGTDTITFSSSLNGLTIALTILGSDNSSNAGDLDIRDNLIIVGNGLANTVVDGVAISDRVFHVFPSINVEFNDLTIQNGNVTDFGGGIYNNGGTVTIVNSLIDSNTAGDDGGGVASNNSGTTTITNSFVSNNSAVDDGGGISNNNGSVMNIMNSTVSDNDVTGNPLGSDAGGVRNNNSIMTIDDSLIDGNSGLDDAGGVFNSGTTSVITITNSTISNNTASNVGGGVYNADGTTTINSSTIQNNSATGAALNNGGGVFNLDGIVNINNSTLSGNAAYGGSQESSGGAIFNDGTMHIYNSTIANNSVFGSPPPPYFEAGGITNDGFATMTIDNSIVTNNANGDCTNGNMGSLTGANNLIDDYLLVPCNAISTEAVSNFETTLADNGGPTLTHALFSGSNAIDAGGNSCPDNLGSPLTADQRGITRPLDGDGDSVATCDVGSFEIGDMQCDIQAAAEPITYTLGTIAVEVQDDGTDLDCLLVTHIDGNHPNATPGIQTGQYWLIEALQTDRSTPATADYVADLTLPHTVTPHMNAYVCRWTTGWNCARTSSTATTVRRDNVPGFSAWAVGDSVTPTAVTLYNFSVKTAVTPLTILLLFSLFTGRLFLWRRER